MKILIDNEEVVSGKDFTITEEMLNTPSVILNNVYPKAWENDKDYISRFYYPKDYSKCLIYDSDENLYPYTVYGKTTQETIEGEEGTTVEGQEISITDYDSSKEHEILVEGESTQEGTPTPENPQEIEDATGLQKVELVGKNLFNKNTITTGAYLKEDGTLQTGTGAAYITSDFIPVQPNTTYYKTQTLSPRTKFYDANKQVLDNSTYQDISIGGNAGSFTTPSNAYYFRFTGNVNTSTGIDINAVMVHKGSTSTEYEPYKSKTYDLNFGKNLFDKDNIISGYGLNSGSDTTYPDSSRSYLNYTVVKPNTSYTISSVNCKVIHFLNNKKSFISSINPNGNSFITPNNTKYIRISFDNTEDYSQAQLEKGPKATSYSAYFEPIYLRSNKDKTVRDYVHKIGSDWYIHRQINEIVLDGTWNNITIDTSKTNTTRVRFNSIGPNSIDNTFINQLSNQLLNSNIYNTDTEGFYMTNTGNLMVRMNKERIGITTSAINNYFSTNNLIVQYQLAEPIEEQITNTELISQLEELYNDEFFDGVNNISTSGIYLNLHYNYVTPMPSPERPSRMINLTGNVELEIEGNTYRLSLGEKELCSNKDETIRDFIQKDEDDKWYINKRIGIIENYNGEEITTEYMSTTGELTIGTKVQYVLENIEKEEITDETLIRQLESIGNLLIFCGVVKNSGKISLNPRYPHFCDLQILDFKMFLSEVILDFVIANKTIEEAIQQVTSFISSYGFVVGNIELANPNEMIGAYSTKDKSPYDVFNYLADITQSRWTTRMVDQNTVAIDFYNPELMEQGAAIEYTTQWFEDNKIDDISYSYGTYDYRNKQIMTSDKVMANISSTESIYANGYQTQYNTEKKIGNVSSVTLNGISKTITTNENKELGQTADFYYTVGNNYIESETPLSAGDTIVINYIAIVQGRQIITNSTEINRVASSTGRNGTLARYENRNDATTSDELQKIGQSYIKYKGTPEIKLNISTRNNIWEIGQKVEFNAPITELSTEYMVKRKDVKYIATIDTIFYTYELTSSFNSEREINYFDNQRAKANGNIGAGEYISRNVDIENTAEIIFYDTELSEKSSLNN